MTKFIIGFGKCSKYLLFILGTVVFKTLNNFTFENQISLKSEGGIFGFVPIYQIIFLFNISINI